MVPPYRPAPGSPLARRDRRLAALLGAGLLSAGTAFGAWVATRPPPPPGQRCVDVMVASTTGGVALHTCGEAARTFCAAEGASADPWAVRARAACRAAGFGP